MKTGLFYSGIAFACLLVGTGCTHVAKARAKLDARLDDHSRTFTTAVVDALQLQPTERRDPFTAAALQTARHNLVKVEKYRGRRADFLPFAASVFSPHIYTGRERARVGCGAGALALITGVPPEKIAAKHPGRHYSDRFMIRFLKRRGFRVLRLTPLRISSALNPIGNEHVILVSQLISDYTASWSVLFDTLAYHNFAAYNLSGLAGLNKPILSAYLIIHPSWRVAEDFELPRHVRRLAGPKFKVSDLRKGAEFSGLRNWA